MKYSLLVSLIVFGIGLGTSIESYSEDSHSHGKSSKKDEHKKHDDHDEKESSHKDEHKKHDDHDEKESSHKDEHKKHDDHDDGDKAHSESEDGHNEEGHGKHAENEGQDEHENTGVGPDKAIREFNESSESFKLSPETISLIGIKESTIRSEDSPNTFRVPRQSVVEYQDKTGVFVLTNGWYKLVEIEILRKNQKSAIVRSAKLSGSDLVSVSGLGTLRSAFLQVTGQGGKGHAH